MDAKNSGRKREIMGEVAEEKKKKNLLPPDLAQLSTHGWFVYVCSLFFFQSHPHHAKSVLNLP